MTARYVREDMRGLKDAPAAEGASHKASTVTAGLPPVPPLVQTLAAATSGGWNRGVWM